MVWAAECTLLKVFVQSGRSPAVGGRPGEGDRALE